MHRNPLSESLASKEDSHHCQIASFGLRSFNGEADTLPIAVTGKFLAEVLKLAPDKTPPKHSHGDKRRQNRKSFCPACVLGTDDQEDKKRLQSGNFHKGMLFCFVCVFSLLFAVSQRLVLPGKPSKRYLV